MDGATKTSDSFVFHYKWHFSTSFLSSSDDLSKTSRHSRNFNEISGCIVPTNSDFSRDQIDHEASRLPRKVLRDFPKIRLVQSSWIGSIRTAGYELEECYIRHWEPLAKLVVCIPPATIRVVEFSRISVLEWYALFGQTRTTYSAAERYARIIITAIASLF